MKIIFLAGAPGSGKSTHGTALMKMNSKIKHLSLGDVVRERLKNPEDPITSQYQELINSGQLLPDNVIFEILQHEIEKIEDQDTLLLLDGYPRTQAQYEQFKAKWGLPSGLIHLDVDLESLKSRLKNRKTERGDDNEDAIIKRLEFYNIATNPLLDLIKKEIPKSAITVSTQDSIKAISLYLYTKLHEIQVIHEVLKADFTVNNHAGEINTAVNPIWFSSLIDKLYETGNEYRTVDFIQDAFNTQNFSCSLLHKKIVYLETPSEVQSVLGAKSTLGPVYRHFSNAAGLHYDFVATDAHQDTWKLMHVALADSLKNDKSRIEDLIDKYLPKRFFAKKTFNLDTTFDTFFCAFWSKYLFGDSVSVGSYMETRERIVKAMQYCFYGNYYKGIEPFGLSSYLFSFGVSNDLKETKAKIKTYIDNATPDSLVQKFKSSLIKQNKAIETNLSDDILQKILVDCVFDLVFEPDFLESVMYEALVAVIKNNVNLGDEEERKYAYAQGVQNGFLFPIRSRILDEAVTLPDRSTILPAGSYVYFNLKKAGVYHSSGPRRCVGQAYSYYFKEHFFNRLASFDFKLKSISYPEDRALQSGNENIPVSPERYQVSWKLKREEAMRHLSFHNYKGNKFFNVLSLHQKPHLNALMVKDCELKIKSYLQQNDLSIRELVIASPEVRGIPIASQVAERLNLPLYIIRKKGGNKMSPDDVFEESYYKGYNDKDTVEFPKKESDEIRGKTVIFIDDGIASGNSALACIALLEISAKVPMVLTILQHDYTSIAPKLSELKSVKTLFDCHGGPVDEPKASQCELTLTLEQK